MLSVLSSGVYTVPDAARILGLSLPKLRRWLKDSEAGALKNAPARYGITALGIEGEGSSKHMDFLSLIELYTVMRLRELGVSFSKIRKAREDLATRLGVKHPFATQSLFVDGAKLLTENDNLLYELGTNGQIAIRKILEPFWNRVDFEESSLIAKQFHPHGRDHHVVVDPRRSFGRPVVTGTSVTTEALASLFHGGESIEGLSQQFDLTEAEISDALAFEDCIAA
jgi:uncharacterized protein (DUF433 family)